MLAWYSRVNRYMLVYFILALSVLGLRMVLGLYQEQYRKSMKELGALNTEYDTLQTTIKAQTNNPDIGKWAKIHGMILLTDARQSQSLNFPIQALIIPEPKPVEVVTQWR